MSEKLSKSISFGIFAIIIAVTAFAITTNSQKANSLSPPLNNFEKREKLLTFGLFVTPDPDNNPIDPPERFSGYHTALDLEILDDEHDKDVEVYAACDGKIIYQQTAAGYGGVIIQSCHIQNQDITVLYGHVNPKSFTKSLGDQARKGEKIAILGDHKTEETGDTRKHLHFGVHKGSEPALAGYVESESELNNYIDPMSLF